MKIISTHLLLALIGLYLILSNAAEPDFGTSAALLFFLVMSGSINRCRISVKIGVVNDAFNDYQKRKIYNV